MSRTKIFNRKQEWTVLDKRPNSFLLRLKIYELQWW